MDFVFEPSTLKELSAIALALIAFLRAKKKWDTERQEIKAKVDLKLEKLSKDSQSELLKIFAEMDAKNKIENASLRSELIQIISTQNQTIAELNHQVCVIQKDLEKCHDERSKLMVFLERSK